MKAQALLAKLRRRFSDKPNAIQIRSGVAGLPLQSLHPHWILGRGLCMYRCADFSHVPRNRRRAALDMQLPIWSPFENTDSHCVWSGAAAMVWFWNQDEVQQEALAEATGAAPDGPRPLIRPETLFLPKKPDGLHLQACREGYDLQRWQSGRLEDSFWFAERPEPAQIQRFCASKGHADLQGEADVPVALANLSAEPWSGSAAPREWVEANERRLAWAGLALFALAFVWQEARFWKLHTSGESAAGQLAQLQDQLDPVLKARNALLRLRTANRALVGILNEPSQARIMGIVDQALPSEAARFDNWRYQLGELRLVIEDPNPDPIAYVRALEAQPLLQQVRVGTAQRSDQLQINLQVGS